MGVTDWLQLTLLLALLLFSAKPLGTYIYHVLTPEGTTPLDRFIRPIEKRIYHHARIDSTHEHTWREYLIHLLTFSGASFILTYLFLALQHYLPLNPQKFNAPSWHLNFNTSISFMTNTNWQSYGGESTLSYFSQMAALTVQNFVSAAVGLCVAAVLVRGLSRRSSKTIGNFWTDLVRINLYLLLPICLIASLLFISQGVPQNFNSYAQAKTLETGSTQLIAQGPIASQEAIKLLGTNGGGFTNVNSAHPYENPTPFANFLQMFLILLIPVAQFYYFGLAINDRRHAWCLIAALTILFIAGVVICAHCEASSVAELLSLGATGGNWEGKEMRFGIFGSALFSCVTTATSCGAVNSALDSYTPIGGMIPLLNMELTEIIFGGVGAGLFSLILFALLAIFLAGLIIGRTPEYLNQKIGIKDIKMTVLAVIPYVLLVHAGTALTCFTHWGIQGLGNTGPHGFSEMLYAFSSCTANNGSAFAGLSANTAPYNVSLGFAMLLGRFLVIIPVIALGGYLAKKRSHPPSAASFPVSSPLFITLLIAVILIVGALTFFPALTLGPLIEHFLMKQGALS